MTDKMGYRIKPMILCFCLIDRSDGIKEKTNVKQRCFFAVVFREGNAMVQEEVVVVQEGEAVRC